MTTSPITIFPFHNQHQPGIDMLMASIAKEFPEAIFSPQSKTMKEVSQLPAHAYWVAECNGQVVGTIGLIFLNEGGVELKRMFLNKEFRGRGIAQALLDTVVNAAKDRKVSCVYLGTMTQFKAAQVFYEKSGFVEISKASLPTGFLANPVDSVFYKMDL